MSNRRFHFMIATAAVVAVLSLARVSASGQTMGTKGGCPEEPAHFHPCATAKAKTFNPPRTPDGKPDLQGFWTRSGSLSNIEEHPASTPTVLAGGDRGGKSLIVEPADGKIPYQPWAVAQRKENVEHYVAPPWKMAFGVTRRQERGYEPIEEACLEGDRDRPLYNLGYKTYRGVVPPK